jgi:hypothetical protein
LVFFGWLLIGCEGKLAISSIKRPIQAYGDSMPIPALKMSPIIEQQLKPFVKSSTTIKFITVNFSSPKDYAQTKEMSTC